MFIVVTTVAGLVGFALWSRHVGARPDHPGARTVCRFAGGSRLLTDDERARHWHEGAGALGEGVLLALRAHLDRAGFSTEQPRAETVGASMRIALARASARLHVVSTAYEPDIWELAVLHRSNGGPGPVELLAAVDRGIRSMPDLARVAWHRREDRDRSVAYATPLDP